MPSMLGRVQTVYVKQLQPSFLRYVSLFFIIITMMGCWSGVRPKTHCFLVLGMKSTSHQFLTALHWCLFLRDDVWCKAAAWPRGKCFLWSGCWDHTAHMACWEQLPIWLRVPEYLQNPPSPYLLLSFPFSVFLSVYLNNPGGPAETSSAVPIETTATEPSGFPLPRQRQSAAMLLSWLLSWGWIWWV